VFVLTVSASKSLASKKHLKLSMLHLDLDSNTCNIFRVLVEVQKPSTARHNNVIKRLKEEIERLHHHSERLLHGYSKAANPGAMDGNKP
jgi:hypothetical protein